MIVSAMSTATMEDIRASAPECLLWQQMYIFKNRSLTESMIRRAEHQGFGAIVVTVDSPVTGQAVSLGKHMFVLPDGLRNVSQEYHQVRGVQSGTRPVVGHRVGQAE
ncbi:hypothetical protein HPB51_018363 [Rhipicephalus microplus]|uniref:FMN hydroxy acid dehydrogenase domain-containing protein n=1 Tax=Rhipicephalus microplus TaxID=6941 RepID=A0A9J6ETQ9_RHIMP|nr:hypothetical protein HPB51_018363 [Rhipicephalus microplus]